MSCFQILLSNSTCAATTSGYVAVEDVTFIASGSSVSVATSSSKAGGVLRTSKYSTDVESPPPDLLLRAYA